MTRDSRILTFIQLSAFVAGLVANTINDPLSYGLSVMAVKWINLAALVLSGISGWLRTSPLPGENDDTRISRDGRNSDTLVKEN